MILRNILIPTAAALSLGVAAPAMASPPAPPAIAQIARAALPAVVDIESIDPLKAGHGENGMHGPGDHDNGDHDNANHDNGGSTAMPGSHPADTSPLIVPPRAEQALGTGFFIRPDGYIVTNHHVIAGASEIKVTLHDGHIYTAKLIGADKKADLAVLKIDAGHKVPYLRFGSSARMGLGDWVVAIGNPFGLGFSISAGVVSALHRDIGSGPFDNFIQTDAAINRGNSGGPLLNSHGEVIGVDSAIYSPSGGSVGIGFAIPSSMVNPVSAAIIAHGSMKRGWAGLRIEHVSALMQTAWHLKSKDGVVVAGVVPHGPSAGALRPSDIITKVDDAPIIDAHGFRVAVAEIPVGQVAHVTFRQDGAIHQGDVTIRTPPATWPQPHPKKPANTPPGPDEIAALGIGVEVHPGHAGVVIVKVDKKGAAARAGVKADTLIEAVGPEFVTDAAHLRTLLAGKKTVSLLIDGPSGISWVAVPLVTPAIKAASTDKREPQQRHP